MRRLSSTEAREGIIEAANAAAADRIRSEQRPDPTAMRAATMLHESFGAANTRDPSLALRQLHSAYEQAVQHKVRPPSAGNRLTTTPPAPVSFRRFQLQRDWDKKAK